LVPLLAQCENQLSDEWIRELKRGPLFEAMDKSGSEASLVAVFFRDLRRVMNKKLPALQTQASAATSNNAGPFEAYGLTLCQGIDAVLTGKMTIRRFIRAHLNVPEAELLVTDELLNRVVQQLVRYYLMRYAISGCVEPTS
jgi:hypothetical protein